MKKLLLLLPLLLVACQSPGGPPVDVAAVVKTATDAVVAADRNADGRVSSSEAKDFTQSPAVWIGILSTLLGGAGLLKANSANKVAEKVAVETDEQWDHLQKLGKP
jgi:hypothetical protein